MPEDDLYEPSRAFIEARGGACVEKRVRQAEGIADVLAVRLSGLAHITPDQPISRGELFRSACATRS
jgi:hypothetical protein